MKPILGWSCRAMAEKVERNTEEAAVLRNSLLVPWRAPQPTLLEFVEIDVEGARCWASSLQNASCVSMGLAYPCFWSVQGSGSEYNEVWISLETKVLEMGRRLLVTRY